MDQSIPVRETILALNAGKVILYPTDTVWGLGCDATNNEAIERILAFKERPLGNGLICLVDSVEMLQNYVGPVHPRLNTLLEHHRRPLTIIYEKVDGLPKSVLAKDGSCAIRVTSDKFCQEIIKGLGKPIVSTSANTKGNSSPMHFGSVSSDVLQAVDYVAKHRQRDKSEVEPSTIAKWSEDNEIEIIRP